VTRCARVTAPRPRPTSWGCRSLGCAHARQSHPSTRWPCRPWSSAATSVASSVLCRLPRPLAGVSAASFFSAWARRVSSPCTWRSAGPGERSTTTRSPHGAARSSRPHGRSIASPAAASTSAARCVLRPTRSRPPSLPCSLPALLHSASASAVVPVNGRGDRDTCWRPATSARVPTALS